MLILLSAIHKQHVILHLIYAFLKPHCAILLPATFCNLLCCFSQTNAATQISAESKEPQAVAIPIGKKGLVGTILRSGKPRDSHATGSQRCCGKKEIPDFP